MYLLWRVSILGMALLSPAVAADAQETAATSGPRNANPGPTSYDVASIHEHNPDDSSMFWRSNPEGFSASNISLQNLAASAYGIRMMDLVTGGPSWVTGKHFDLSAKVLPADGQGAVKLTDEQRTALLRDLLAERFHLQTHLETRTMPVYDLIVSKGGLKMKATSPAEAEPGSHVTDPPRKPNGTSYVSDGRLQAYGYTMDMIAGQLGAFVGKIVSNRTGLSGKYDFTLEYTPEGVLARSGEAAAAAARPDLLTALQEQLGLKLVPSKGQLTALVIDHAELPTPN